MKKVLSIAIQSVKRVVKRMVESGMIPDPAIRIILEKVHADRLMRESLGDIEARHEVFRRFLQTLSQSVITVPSERTAAKDRDLPVEFFQRVLGPRLLFSSGYYPTGGESLDEAEETMLWMICERARIQDGQRVLVLDCGWGALPLWLARAYPEAQITALTPSVSQKLYLQKQCRKQNLERIAVLPSELAEFSAQSAFDRVLLIEPWEGVRNWKLLLEKTATALAPSGQAFVQVLTHRHYSYLIDPDGEDGWVWRNLWPEGMILSDDFLFHFQEQFSMADHWRISGIHPAKTADKWLANLYRGKEEIMPLLEVAYGKKLAALWFQRWRLFLLGWSELWGFDRGQHWLVSQYLLQKRG